jgi:LacI family transcriptional regulator
VSVDADNFAGAYEIVSHFIKVHRFTKIVYVAGVANFEGVGERFTAYNKALMDNGIEPDKALYVENTEMTEVAGALAFWKISKVLKPPYAVFAATDTLAYGYMKAAQKAGLRVPEDVAIAGFDDSVMAEYCEPGLTTARQPFRDIGRIAATELISMVDRKTASSGIIKLPTKLIIRGSCGCC